MPDAGKVAFVTGASRGIGRSVAVELARLGCDVAVGYRASEAEAMAVCDEIRALGRQALPVQVDVSIADECRRAAAQVRRELGIVTILVNNAGMFLPATLDTLTDAIWQKMLDANLTSAFILTQAFLPEMRAARWGRLIFLSSVAAQTGGVIGPHYAASKAALHGLMHSYAALLAKEGITSNVIAPALIDTDMVRNNPRARPDLIPVGRFGHVDEVTQVVTMLVQNGYITGQTINVNGGWYMS
jgi:3-oxoacyl-[acyl-carrier protein] reductase